MARMRSSGGDAGACSSCRAPSCSATSAVRSGGLVITFFKPVLNAAAFQAGWLACVLGAAHGLPWGGIVVAAAIVAWHALRARQPREELKLVALAVAVGALADSALAASGWV